MKSLIKQYTIKLFLTILALTFTASNVFSAVQVDDLLIKYKTSPASEFSELNNTTYLPDSGPTEIIVEAIKFMLDVSGILLFLGFSVSGIMFVLSRGEGDSNMLELAKKTALYTAVGAIVIMVSYAIVYGVTAVLYD